MLTSLRHTHLSSAERDVYRRVRSELDIPPVDPGAAEVLVDISDTFCECIEQLAFARYFSERFGLQAAAYVPGFTANRRRLYRLLGDRTNFVLSRGYRLARAHGMGHGLDAGSANATMLAAARRDAAQFLADVKNKEEMLAYRVLRVDIGVAIYDSYLRETMQATVRPESSKFREIVLEAFLILRVTVEYFRTHRVRVVVLGHCVYNNWKILSDYARTQGAQVFVTYNSRSIPLHDVNANRGLQTTDHTAYKTGFLALDAAQQQAGRLAGRELLARRVSGELDPGLSYMSTSAFAGGDKEAPVQIALGKKAIVLMLHSFFDSPHVYKEMIFPDFLAWVHETLTACGTEAMRAQYEVLVKPHPNRFAQEDPLIASIMAAHPHAKLLPAETSNLTVAGMRPACIVTVYGSVAAEFSYLRVPVITCGDNPASSFGFTFEARTQSEYVRLLEQAADLEVSPQQLDEVGEFMFMHYIHRQPPSATSYPFGRSTPHGRQKGHERVGDFRFEDFSRLVDHKLDALDPPALRDVRGKCTVRQGL